MFPDVIRYTNLTRNKLCFVVFISLFDARQIQRDYVKHNDARVMITWYGPQNHEHKDANEDRISLRLYQTPTK